MQNIYTICILKPLVKFANIHRGLPTRINVRLEKIDKLCIYIRLHSLCKKN